MTKSNATVAQYFVAERVASSGHLYTDGRELDSYVTAIAYRTSNDQILLNSDHYSVSTSRHQSEAWFACHSMLRPGYYAEVSFSALRRAKRGGIHDVQILDVRDDSALLKVPGDATIGDRYLLSDVDRITSRARNPQRFLCELCRPCVSIADAYDSLVPDAVRTEQEKGTEVLRQGDWYFAATKFRFPRIQGSATPIANGSQHFAHYSHLLDTVMYVSGTVKHPEHRMLRLGNRWWWPVKNTAIASWSSGGSAD
mgnify:CR=1 FL=1